MQVNALASFKHLKAAELHGIGASAAFLLACFPTRLTLARFQLFIRKNLPQKTAMADETPAT
jgi:hypothetical protein